MTSWAGKVLQAERERVEIFVEPMGEGFQVGRRVGTDGVSFACVRFTRSELLEAATKALDVLGVEEAP